jgi:hypothetical protein
MSKIISLPAPDCDLLTGRDQIAAWFGISDGQASARINSGDILTFKLYGKTTVYALKSENMEFWKSMANKYRSGRLIANAAAE